ncbi:MAG: hypothetical protein AB7L94_25170 [Kofleriaceae bacterium]
MTIIDEGKRLRRDISTLRSDRRRRYPVGLKQRILSWVSRAVGDGMMESECARVLGVKSYRFVMWRREEAPLAMPDVPASESLALVPIELTESPMLSTISTSGVTLVSPTGYRVEGLTVDQVVDVLRGIR